MHQIFERCHIHVRAVADWKSYPRKKVEKGDKFTALKRFWSRWDERGLIFYTTV